MNQDCGDTWAHLNENTPFNHLFPSGVVPVQSIFPIVPGKEGNPPCYLVDARFLSECQIQGLASMILAQDHSPITDEQEAIAYIKSGLPVQTKWFCGFGTSNVGVALSLADGAGAAHDFDHDFDLYGDYDDGL